MHWKTRRKLTSTTKIYLTVTADNNEKCHEVRLQLPTNEYVLLELHQPIPDKPLYNSLSNGGFNRDESIEDGITHYGKTRAINILNSSKGYRNNSSETIDDLVELIQGMGHI